MSSHFELTFLLVTEARFAATPAGEPARSTARGPRRRWRRMEARAAPALPARRFAELALLLPGARGKIR